MVLAVVKVEHNHSAEDVVVVAAAADLGVEGAGSKLHAPVVFAGGVDAEARGEDTQAGDGT